MEHDKESIGLRMKELRKSLGLSQKQFSYHLNIAHNTLSRYESDMRQPGKKIFLILKKSFFCNLNWLIAGEGDMFSYENLSFKDIESLKKFLIFITKTGNFFEKSISADSSDPWIQ